jgi:hypothetical protein
MEVVDHHHHHNLRRESIHDFVSLNDNDPNFDRKFGLATEGARPFVKEHLLTRISRENCSIIIAYILAMQTEINPSERYRIDTIYMLKQLAEFHKPKSFREMIRQDIIDFLDKSRKPDQVDPLHKWIATYELSRIYLIRYVTSATIFQASLVAVTSRHTPK